MTHQGGFARSHIALNTQQFAVQFMLYIEPMIIFIGLKKPVARLLQLGPTGLVEIFLHILERKCVDEIRNFKPFFQE